MARKSIDASDLGEVANDLRGLRRDLRRTYSTTLDLVANELTDKVEEEAPRQSRPDGKESQIALADSFKWGKTGPYSAIIGSSAPHAIPVETGWDSGDWQIPKSPTGVGWPASRISDNTFFLPNNGGYYDKESGKIYYPQVDVGRFKGNNYNQTAARKYVLSGSFGDRFDFETEEAIVRAGFNEI